MMQILCAHCRRSNRVIKESAEANPRCEGCGRELVVAAVAESADAPPGTGRAIPAWQLAETQEIEVPVTMTGKVIAVSKQAPTPIESPVTKAGDVISVSQLAETQEIELPPPKAPDA